MNIVICDSDKEYIYYLKNLILKSETVLKNPNRTLFVEFASGRALLSYIKKAKSQCDVLIMDMELSDVDIEETARVFRQKYTQAVFVCCTNICKPVDNIIKYRPFRYWYKDYDDNRMQLEVSELLGEAERVGSEPVILGHNYNRHIKLLPEEILFIECSKRGCKINICPLYVENIKYKIWNTEKKLHELYSVLSQYGFEYAHNSYIVNLRFVKKLSSVELEYVRFWQNAPVMLSVSRARKDELRKKFEEFNI